MSAHVEGKEILIATANEEDARQLRELCEGAGYKVGRVETGDEVLEAVAGHKADVLLLDLAIRRKDGIRVLKEIRDNRAWNDLPIVILTDLEDLDSKVYGMELGADDYMTRPFKPVELQTRVGSALMVREYRRRLMAVEAELEQLRALDPVSGAGTASQLKSNLESEIARARRYGRPAAALVMGIDAYEDLRSKLGGDRCDDYVGRVAKAIRHTLRGADRLFRVQPDEFVIMLPETDLKGARMAAERLGKIVNAIPVTGRQGSQVEARIRFGGSVFPYENVRSAEELVREATQSYRSLRDSGTDKLIFDIPG